MFRYSRTGAAVPVAAIVLGVFWVPPTIAAGPPWTVAGGVLAAIAGAAMLLGRRWPFGATVVAGVATVAGNALGVSEDPMLATAWCLYPLAVARAVRTRRVVLIFAVLLVLLAAVTAVPGDAGGMGRLGRGPIGPGSSSPAGTAEPTVRSAALAVSADPM